MNELNSLNKPIKLIYRGLTFEYTPQPIPTQSNMTLINSQNCDKNKVKLIYRGLTFEYTPPPVQPYRKPTVLNWRFQAWHKRWEEKQR